MTLSPRLTFFSTALLCAALLGYGYYLEYVEFLDPCNLCKLQRVAFMAVILFAVIGTVHGTRIHARVVALAGCLPRSADRFWQLRRNRLELSRTVDRRLGPRMVRGNRAGEPDLGHQRLPPGLLNTGILESLCGKARPIHTVGADAVERVMDSNALEKERGITILSKNTAIRWNDYRINIVDTPGHADFGGEVERVLSMVDSVLLLVDAVDGPMPQTRFVTQKAFALGFKPIVVINKVDRDGARPDWALDQTFDLFDNLGATDEQLDFPVVYASALNGYAGLDSDVRSGDMTPLFETIVEQVPSPDVDLDGPFQMQISTLDYNSYQGVIGIGRVKRGRIGNNEAVKVISADGTARSGRLLQSFGFIGLERVAVDEASAGDIVAITGLDPLDISETLCDPNNIEALPPLSVDEPTISMTFQPNTSPFSGRDGKYVTSRQIWERLQQELKHKKRCAAKATSSPSDGPRSSLSNVTAPNSNPTSSSALTSRKRTRGRSWSVSVSARPN